MIHIEWGNFIFETEGTPAFLLAAIPILLIMYIPQVQRIIHSLVRKTRSSKLASSIEHRIKRAEQER